MKFLDEFILDQLPDEKFNMYMREIRHVRINIGEYIATRHKNLEVSNFINFLDKCLREHFKDENDVIYTHLLIEYAMSILTANKIHPLIWSTIIRGVHRSKSEE